MAEVLVLGGGFGGLAAATELRGRLDPDDEVVLVARDDHFAMGFAKLWDLAGTRPLADGTRRLTDLDRRGIRFRQATVSGIDAERRRVTTADGAVMDGDALIVALGVTGAPAHRRMLEARNAHDLYDAAALPAMRAALGEVEAGRVVVSILGGPFRCPPAPFEAALIADGILRERGVRDRVQVTLTTPQPLALPVAGVDASRYVADHLGDHDIELRTGTRVSAVDGDAGSLTLVPAGGAGPADPDDEEELDYTVLLGVPADSPSEPVRDTALVGASGWIEPDPRTLRTTFDRVYAVGDCTAIPTATAQLPHAGVFAAAQGRVAAANVVADLTGRSGASFDGHGFCFLELPGEQVAFVEGDFYADPPDVVLTPAGTELFERKQAYEREQLAAWFD